MVFDLFRSQNPLMLCQMHGESQTLAQVVLNDAAKSLVPQLSFGKQYNSSINNFEIMFLYGKDNTQK